ncbi:hypothetical protein [uncultured Desulfosarcina sp.]|uniref:hypothetical protein n=1 Tax=uncultured Desulfosarcina sp. TaxID=218289 RepID=UPI0029C63712|nr:hypothetical protein [uncultured Desulfosarcina sp.]
MAVFSLIFDVSLDAKGLKASYHKRRFLNIKRMSPRRNIFSDAFPGNQNTQGWAKRFLAKFQTSIAGTFFYLKNNNMKKSFIRLP